MNNQIRISFEVEDNYNIQSFRNFVKLLLSDDKYDVFIISNANNSSYIKSIGEQLKLPISNVIITNFNNTKIKAIVDNKIQIHFDNLQSFILLVDETTEAEGILVTANMNKFYLEYDYILTFQQLLKKIECE